MANASVIVEDLGKQYRIGAAREAYRTLRDAVADFAKEPLQRIAAVTRGRASEAHTETMWALRNCSFSVRTGEVLGVVGPNGAGKSTLLKILSRITKPTEGTVLIAGRVGSLLEVGTGFHPELTGRENVYLNGAILGMSKAEIDGKFSDIAAFAGVERFLETPVKRYSSGMYVRLAFSVAAHLEPDVLLVDEVLSVGDMSFQQKSLDRMGEVASSGRTVIFVSHNLAAVRALCHSCLYLDHGAVQAYGPVDEILPIYMQSQRASAGKTWRIAQNNQKTKAKPVYIGEVSLTNTGSVVPVDQPIEVVIRFIVTTDESDVIPGITVWDSGGVQLFSTADWQVPRLNSGTYVARCEIPAYLLSAGIHSVSAHIFDSYRPGLNDLPIDLVEHAISFEVDPAPWVKRTGNRWLRSWPGAVRPDIPWSTHGTIRR